MSALKTFFFAINIFSCFCAFGHDKERVDSLMNRLVHEEDKRQRGELYLALADCFGYSDVIKSYDYIEKVRSLAEQEGYNDLLSKGNFLLANLLIRQGKLNEALQCLNDELAELDKEEQAYKHVVLLANIGAIYYSLEESDTALSFFMKALELVETGKVDCSERKSVEIIIVIKNNIGNVYGDMNDNAKALMYYKEALVMTRKIDAKEHLGVITKNIGDLYIEVNRREEALPFIRESIDIREEIGDLAGVASSYCLLGDYYRDEDNSKKAIDAYQISLQQGLKANAWLVISETAQKLYQTFKQQGDYKRSLEYFQTYHQYNDSLMLQNSEKQRASIEFDYQMQQRQQQWEEQQRKERYLHYLVGAALLIVVSYLMLLFLLSRARMKRIKLEQKNLVLEKEHLEQDLHLKKKELTTNVMYLVRKNELIKEVAQRLMNDLGKFKPQNQKIIQGVMMDLQQSLDNDVWEEFELRFNQVHSDFYERLRSDFPDLTPNEVKLSAFLRLNMSSKEISAITHQTIRSIEVARTRLRKKLNLTNTDTGLVAFLNQF
ncbi:MULTISPECIES: tetratricopeptide repeat protein [unclassified Carboxylicivirga]|uniref:tetratricopeptide repeat protein n=1 Tax=Carboxylicivirga TaxID=1628153 RepID=UPI003D3332DF